MDETSRHSTFDHLRHKAEKYLKERGVGKPSDREPDILAAIDDLELRYAQLQMNLESIADGFFACDADWRLIYVNGAAERMLGISKTEVLGKTHREVFPASLAARLESEYSRAGEVRDFEVFFEPRGRWFRGRCFPRGDGAISVCLEDITELKPEEETLGRSEERFRELAENIREVFCIYSPEEMIYVSPAYEKVWGKSRESLYRKPSSFLSSVHREDKERVRKAYDADRRGTAPFHEEFRILRSDGTLRWIRARSFPVSVQGGIARAVGIAEDITTVKEAEKFLSIERDLAFGIGSSASLAEGMTYLLNACLNFEGLDSGAIYMVDPKSGALNLICHRGISDSFSQATSFYEAASPQSRFAMKARPRFWSKPFAIPELNDLFEREGFLAFLAIPVVYEGEVVALLCLASHGKPEIPENVQLAFEIIANHIGGIISRVRLVDTVRAQGERLQEANTALRVLLKQRDEDRTELEESLLRNVKHLIAPCLDKLKKSRLTVDQLHFVEILESHLREITSPFVHKLSAPMLGLTPTEIRVAELIRQGKSSKEIGELLGITENSVIFHRQGIRRKLDLTGKKLNLQTYLGTLQ